MKKTDRARPGVKSAVKAAGGQPLRSRGFLSQGTPEGEAMPERARGMREAVNDQTPRELDPPKPRRPYRVTDKGGRQP